MPGLGLRLGLRWRYRHVLAVLSLRQQVEGLRDRSTPNGRTSTAALKRPGVDALPPGMTLSGTAVINSSYAGDLEDWDFTGHMLSVRTAMGAIRQCVFGEATPRGLFAYLECYTTGLVTAFEHNDLTGPSTYGGASTAINCRSSGSGTAIVAGRVCAIRRNRFTGLTSDCIKAVGDPGAEGQVIEWNYFGPPVNLPAVPTPYAATTAYAAGVIVRSAAGHVFRSLVDGNLGNTPPTSKASNALWENLDPHADAITTVMVRNRLTIARNLFDFTNAPLGSPGPLAQVGVNNAFRFSRNTGSDAPVGRIDVEENVSYHGPFSSYPIETKDGGQPNFDGPIAFSGNWIGANGNAAYFHASSNGWIDAWSGNRDVLTGAPIAAPVLRTASVEVPPSPPAPLPPVVVGILSQSEPNYLLEPGQTFNEIPMPTITTENVTVYHCPNGGPVAKVPVTQDSVGARQVNPWIANLSPFFAHVLPGRKVIVADFAQSGTARWQLANDAEAERKWEDAAAVAEAVRADGHDFDAILDYWYASDQPSIPNFDREWSPFYLGQRHDGQPFALGNVNPDSTTNPTRTIDHCLWDAEAPTGERGRGLFSRARTKLYFVGVDIWEGGSGAERLNYTTRADGSTSDTIASSAIGRARIREFLAKVEALGFGGKILPHPPHLSDGHPMTNDPDGQIWFGWPFAAGILDAAGTPVGTPEIVGLEAGPNGAYADLLVSLPNGGELSTLRAIAGRPRPDPEPPHLQPAGVGVEVQRRGQTKRQRRPVFRADATAYPSSARGAVAILDAGSGSPRRGRVRVTPVEPFASGDAVLYGEGHSLLSTRDGPLNLWQDLLFEKVPQWRQADALHPFTGLAVRPMQAPLVLGATPPAAFWTQGASGPYFVDPATVPSGTKAIRFKARLRIPASARHWNGSMTLFSQEAQGFDVQCSSHNQSGTFSIWINKVEDGAGAQVLGYACPISGLGRDQWHEVEFQADFASLTARSWLDGVPHGTAAFTAPGTGAFQTGREISFGALTSGSGRMPEEVQFAAMEALFTNASGVETLRQRIEGDDAAVAAHPWRRVA